MVKGLCQAGAAAAHTRAFEIEGWRLDVNVAASPLG